LDKIIIITAPSGSGKTTLVKQLLEDCRLLEFSISACTRMPRPGEVHGKDYYFYDQDQFQQLIAEGAFIEWEMVYTGKYYGTLHSEFERIWANKRSPLVDIDVQGAMAIKNKFQQASLSIFIQAPSINELRNRLVKRGTETPQSLEERVTKAEYELTFANQFDKILVNDSLVEARKQLAAIVNEFAGC
jgi:guanylate kinase